jgi:hypothetical protein
MRCYAQTDQKGRLYALVCPPPPLYGPQVLSKSKIVRSRLFAPPPSSLPTFLAVTRITPGVSPSFPSLSTRSVLSPSSFMLDPRDPCRFLSPASKGQSVRLSSARTALPWDKPQHPSPPLSVLHFPTQVSSALHFGFR